ncbi:putative transposase [Arthrobacter globiformis NBRC 12137]|uniref:Putative transposase n=1 Tax=Arthrobacter globiformis (strain ATCC 8010 / DSM 20124 / JCM 1332 / NBRC 12137 / NCIMB 8907 / NRRL B-2979 / 168) TaxID=1077972 RepID=H0QIH7_ARTG1|nr:putative transposase [Arthrobacter globiformis NBRC 12137]
MVEGIIYRYRFGIAWRDVPTEFGPWQTIWKRHRRYSGDGTWDSILAALLTVADARGEVDWSISVDPTSTAPTFLAPQGACSNYMNLIAEPDDHAIGRSRGGLSTKIHALVDGKGRPLVLLVAPGQGGDAPMFTHLMNQLKITRAGPGRPRTRPDRVRGDKAYSSKAIRTHLRDRGIIGVIPHPSDQIGHRKRRGSTGGRPPAFDKEDYKRRHVVERNFNIFKQWRALATRYDKLALTYRGGAVLQAMSIWLTALGERPSSGQK